MKIFIINLIIFFTIFNISFSSEKKDCSIYKKISKNYIACKAGNLKKGTVSTAGKLKKKTGSVVNKILGKN